MPKCPSQISFMGRIINRKSFGIFIFLLALGLTGCNPYVHIEQPIANHLIEIKSGTTLGQTFVSHFTGLQGIQVKLEPDKPGTGIIVLHLLESSTASTDIATSRLSIQQVTSPGYYDFTIQPVFPSENHYYYTYLEVQGTGVVKVSDAPGSLYLNGALYQDGKPQESQMAFNLTYDGKLLVRGLANLALDWLGLLLAGIFLFIVPGLSLLLGLWTNSAGLSWPEKTGLSAGLSLALYPILLLLTNLIGLHLGAGYAWLPPLAGLAYLAWRLWQQYQEGSLKLVIQPNWSRLLPDLCFILVCGLVIFTRFWGIRTLVAPMWGDSVHHTMITQLIVDNGGLFNSWQPYADLTTLTYHFGFHSDAAVFQWVTGLPSMQAVLWTGQLINVLAVIALYPLAVKLGRSRWAGVIAVIVAGLLAPMPMFYVNWGRYTQLAGQVTLVASIYLPWVILDNDWIDWKLILLSIVAVTGTALTHYRLLIFNVLFFLAVILLLFRKGRLRQLLVRTTAIGVGSGILCLPWFIHLFSGQILVALGIKMTTLPKNAPASLFEVNQVGSWAGYLPVYLWLMLAMVIAWALWRREKSAVVICLWWSLILLAANPNWLGLPGVGVLTNFAVFIAAYMPAGILLGGAVGWLLEEVHKVHLELPNHWVRIDRASKAYQYRRGILALILLFLIFIISAWQARQRLYDVHSNENAMVTVPDLRAADWIQANTSPGSRFLVNSFFAYNGTIIVGSDAGWWLPLIAHRPTSLPPMSYVTEDGPTPDYARQTNDFLAEVLNKGVTQLDVIKLLVDRNIQYIFIGQRQGRVNFNGPVLEPDQLLASPAFTPVYRQDQVWIFKMNR